MTGKDFSVAREGPKKIGLVWVQEARDRNPCGGEGSRCLHRYTCSGAVCKRVFTPVRFGQARKRVIFRFTEDVLLASRLPQGAQGSFVERIRKDP